MSQSWVSMGVSQMRHFWKELATYIRMSMAGLPLGFSGTQLQGLQTEQGVSSGDVRELTRWLSDPHSNRSLGSTWMNEASEEKLPSFCSFCQLSSSQTPCKESCKTFLASNEHSLPSAKGRAFFFLLERKNKQTEKLTQRGKIYSWVHSWNKIETPDLAWIFIFICNFWLKV